MKNLGQGSSCKGAFGRGVIECVVTAGPVLGVAEQIAATPDAPAARIRVYEPKIDGWVATGRRVGALLAQLVPTIEFRAPRTPFSPAVEAAREAATTARQERERAPMAPAPADHPARKAALTARYCDPDGAGGWAGFIESEARDYIAFIGRDGLCVLYAKRDDAGNVTGLPLTFTRSVKDLDQIRGFDRDLGPDAVHADGPMKKVRHGVEYVIDRPKGSVRSGFDDNGQPFETTMTCDYGFHPRTTGGDGKPVDCYVGEHAEAREVHIISQVRSDGSPDEQKVMIDHRDMLEACRVYYEHTPSRYFGGCFTLSMREYKRQLRTAMKTPETPFIFTHAASVPVEQEGDDDEPMESSRSRALVTSGAPVAPQPAPAAPGRVVVPSADFMRLAAESTVELTMPDALFFRASGTMGAIRESTREVDCVMSDERVDSYGTILRCNWDLHRFVGPTANPVLLWVHNRRADLPPVGTVKDVRQDPAKRALIGTACFDDSSEFDLVVWDKYRKGVMRGFSVGFNPRVARLEMIGQDEVLVFDDIELTELSCAPVPANAGALAMEARQRVLSLTRAAGGKLLSPEGMRAVLEHSMRTMSGVPGEVRSVSPAVPAPVVVGALGDDADEADGEERAAVPYAKTPIVDIAWDEAAARTALEDWATTDGKLDRKKFARGFAYEDKADQKLGAFKLPHHTIRDGKLVCVRNALSAAVGAINGSHGTKVDIPAADLPRVKRHLAKHYIDDGLPSPWEDKGEKRTPHTGETPVTLKRITKDTIRALGAGDACAVACAHCNGELELVHTDLPDSPAHTRALGILTQEKSAAETRAGALEASNSILGTDLIRFMLSLVERDVDALIGTKLDPSERETELDLARSFVNGFTKRVFVDPAKTGPNDAQEYEGMLKWQARVAKLKVRADLGMLGRSSIPADPTRPDLSAARTAGQPAGGPAVRQPAPQGQGRVATTGGSALAAAVEAAAKTPQPAPIDTSGR